MDTTNFSTVRLENTDVLYYNFHRALLVTISCTVSTLGNLILMLIFSQSVRTTDDRGYRRYRVVDVIIASLAVTGLLRGFISGVVQIACFSEGKWLFGAALCQVQAYIEAMLRHAFAWYLGLLSIERYTKHFIPHEYMVTFGLLTVNVMLPGLMLVVIVQVTAPIYGWGQYAYLREIGMCGISTQSNFGCSYATYLSFSLDLPPILTMTIAWMFILLRKKRQSDENRSTSDRDFPSGNSRILENEIRTLSYFVVLFVLFAVPRNILESAAMCECVRNVPSSLLFGLYYLEELSCCILPCLSLSMNSKSRLLLLGVLHVSQRQTAHGQQQANGCPTNVIKP